MEKEIKTITLRLSMDDYKDLKKLCVDLNVSMTQYVRDLIEQDKKKHAKKKA